MRNDVNWWVKQLRAIPAARRLARWWVRGRDARIATGVGKGLRFNSAHSNPAYTLGTNELPVQAALAKHIRPGSVFYDIGANVGFFSVLGAQLVGAAGKVYSFEPVPENASAIRHNLNLNHFQNVTLVEKAVAEADGQAELLVTSYSGGATLASAGSPPDVQRTITVDVISIDSGLKQGLWDAPDVVKVDVEGAELSVLRGMADTLRRCRPILVYEVDDERQEALDQKQAEIAAFLRELGYRLTLLEDSYPESGWLVVNYLAEPASLS